MHLTVLMYLTSVTINMIFFFSVPFQNRKSFIVVYFYDNLKKWVLNFSIATKFGWHNVENSDVGGYGRGYLKLKKTKKQWLATHRFQEMIPILVSNTIQLLVCRSVLDVDWFLKGSKAEVCKGFNQWLWRSIN